MNESGLTTWDELAAPAATPDWYPGELHFSQLKHMGRSPAHYRQAVLEGYAPSRAMDLGSVIHALALGGDVIVFPGDARIGNAWKSFAAIVDGRECYVFDSPHNGKAWQWAKDEAGARAIVTSADVEAAKAARELQAARRAAGKHDATIVTAPEYAAAQGCVEALAAHAHAAELLAGMRELELRWTFLGRKCAGRLDVLAAIERRITELKMATRAEPEWFTKNAIRLGYHAQLDWYATGARENGWVIEGCYIVAVEPEPPFAITCLEATPRMMEEGAKQNRIWMERLIGCEYSNAWPPYVQSVVPFDWPFELDFGEAD